MKDGHVFARKLAAVSLTFLVEQAPRVLEGCIGERQYLLLSVVRVYLRVDDCRKCDAKFEHLRSHFLGSSMCSEHIG